MVSDGARNSKQILISRNSRWVEDIMSHDIAWYKVISKFVQISDSMQLMITSSL